MSEQSLDHDDVEAQLQQEIDWPQYYVAGEGVDESGFVAAYYRVEGPNGPVSYMNPNRGPYPTTMHDFAMEAQSDNFRWCEKSETPFADTGEGTQ